MTKQDLVSFIRKFSGFNQVTEVTAEELILFWISDVRRQIYFRNTGMSTEVITEVIDSNEYKYRCLFTIDPDMNLATALVLNFQEQIVNSIHYGYKQFIFS